MVATSVHLLHCKIGALKCCVLELSMKLNRGIILRENDKQIVNHMLNGLLLCSRGIFRFIYANSNVLETVEARQHETSFCRDGLNADNRLWSKIQ